MHDIQEPEGEIEEEGGRRAEPIVEETYDAAGTDDNAAPAP